MSGDLELSDLVRIGLVTQLPQGSFARSDRGPFHAGCLEQAPSGRGHCFRPTGHGGRHAFIALSGRVWAVWGEDVHKAARERGQGGYVWTLPEVGEPPC